MKYFLILIFSLSCINRSFADLAEDVVNNSTLKITHEYVTPSIKQELIKNNKEFPALAKVMDAWFRENIGFQNIAPIFAETYEKEFTQSELEQLSRYDDIHKQIAAHKTSEKIARNVSQADLDWYSSFIESELYKRYSELNNRLSKGFSSIVQSLVKENWNDLLRRMEIYKGLNPQ